MNQESIIELQKCDFNCNDCKFFSRDQDAYNHSKTLHHIWQRQHFDLAIRKKIEKAEDWLNKNEWEKAKAIIDEVNNTKFAFTNDAHITFGECIKLLKPLSFIANISMPENSNCFQHRRA